MKVCPSLFKLNSCTKRIFFLRSVIKYISSLVKFPFFGTIGSCYKCSWSSAGPQSRVL